jgi:hypothetical protein
LEDDSEQACFTIDERLRILKSLNFLFNKIDDIYTSASYWALIRSGLSNVEQMARKITIEVLKTNLK